MDEFAKHHDGVMFAGDGFRPGDTYRFSGQWNPVGMLIMLVMGGLAAAVGAPLYAGIQALVAEVRIPFAAYIALIIAFLVAWSISAALVKGAHIGNVRNERLVTLAALIVGVAALYAAWVLWVFFRTETWALKPLVLLRTLVSGPLIVRNIIFMFIESIAFMWLPVFLARSSWRERPFCEPCMTWCRRTEVVVPLTPVEVEGFISRIQTGDHLPEQFGADVGEKGLTAMTVAVGSCPTCNDLHVVTASVSTETEVEKNGKKEKVTTVKEVIKNLVTDRETADAIHAAGRKVDAPHTQSAETS